MDVTREGLNSQNTQTRDNAAAESDMTGKLQVNVTVNVGVIPIENASITMSFTGEPDSALESGATNSSGQSDNGDLKNSHTGRRFF